MLKNLYLICGKSGSGKTWIVDKLHNEYNYKVLKSYTTRPKRHPSDNDHIYFSEKPLLLPQPEDYPYKPQISENREPDYLP